MSDTLFASLADEFGTATETARLDKRIAESIRGGLFPKQEQVLADASRRKAIICPRRAGKSWTSLSYAYYVALTQPRSNCLVVGLTLKSLKGIYWEQVLPRFESLYGVRTTKHHTEMKIRFDNGSLITFAGAETRAEIDKLRGQAYDLVVIDECKSFSPAVLDELVQDVFRRSLMDRKGTIMLIGTPGSILEGAFYEGTYPGAVDKKGVPFSRTYDTPEPYWTANPKNRSWRWSRHCWSVQDNSALPHAWEEALQDKEEEGWPDDHPTWLREYLGVWVSADDVYVYAYAGLTKRDPERVLYNPSGKRAGLNKHGLPEENDYRYVLGMDLGFEDDFAVAVGAYSLNDGKLWHVYDYKCQHLDVYQVAEQVSRIVDRFDNKIDAAVADASGLGKMVIETLNRRHGLNIQPAEKREKYDFIELLNSDFHSGKVRIKEGSDLDLELRTLQWDLTKHTKAELIRANKLREHPALPNHLCDAWLYLWRYSYHTYATPSKPVHRVGTEDWYREWEQASIDRMLNQRNSNVDPLMEAIQERSVDPLEGFYAARNPWQTRNPRSGRS